MCTISIHIVRRCKLVSARQCGSSIIFWMAYKKIVYGFSDCFPIFGGDLWSVNVFTAFFTTKQIFWQATDRNWQAAEQWANMLYGQTEKNTTNDMMWEMVPAVKRSTFQTFRHAGSVVQSYCLFAFFFSAGLSCCLTFQRWPKEMKSVAWEPEKGLSSARTNDFDQLILTN